MGKEFKTAFLGYDKKEVDDYIAKLHADMDALVIESKEKIKQAQAIAMNANSSLDEIRAEFEVLKKRINTTQKI